MPQASVIGNHRGLKPVKKRAATAQPRVVDRTSPATYVDVRNLCWKRRDKCGVKGELTHPRPKRGWRRIGQVLTLAGVVPDPLGVEEAATGCYRL